MHVLPMEGGHANGRKRPTRHAGVLRQSLHWRALKCREGSGFNHYPTAQRNYMANPLVRSLRRVSLSSLLKPSPSFSLSFRKITHHPKSIFSQSGSLTQFSPSKPWWVFRNFSHGSVNLVISQGKPKFETQEVDPPKKEKWKNKKRLKQQRMREKRKRKSANKKDPRCLGVKGKKKKQKFANAEERIKYKLEKARIKEALLIERLKRYEVSKLQGPAIKLDDLTGEERFYMKKMGQKGSNYVPVGRRGIFGGVILNMHMHWKKHETVKVICKPCKPGQVHEYAEEIARLSGGTPIQIVGDDTIIFYRGKSYIQPQVMSPIDTLSKKRALEKSKYEQSLESVRRFIAIAEKELELYYRHVALYGDPNNRNSSSVLGNPRKDSLVPNKVKLSETEDDFEDEGDSTDQELTETEDALEDEGLSVCESDCEDENISTIDLDSCDDVRENSSFGMQESSTTMLGSPSMFRSKWDSDYQEIPRENTLKV